MLAAERRSKLLQRLRGAQVVSTDELSRDLRVSGETIRRDLADLEGQGLLSRVHGGAMLSPASVAGEEASFATRTASGHEAKARIGRLAASLVRPGQLVVIDLGTTALQVARALPMDLVGTVATSSLLVAMELASRPRLEVLVCGGRVRSGDLAVSNSTAQAFFAELNPDIAFLGSGGVAAARGLTDFHLDEVAVRRTMMDTSDRTYVLADSSKFERVARHRVAPFDRFDGLITEAEPPTALRTALTAAGVQVLVASADGHSAADHSGGVR